MNGFRICPLETPTGQMPACSRRDYYTVCLVTGPRRLQQADQPVLLNGTCLLIGDPAGADLSAGAAVRHTGYACRFTAAFFRQNSPASNPAQWSLLNSPVPCVFPLGDEQAAYLRDLFAKMLTEQQATYLFKQELLGAYLSLVLHEATRLRVPVRPRCFRYYCRQSGAENCELRIARRG